MLAVLIRFGREEGLVYIVAAVVPLVIVAAVLTPFIRKHWKLALYAILLMTGIQLLQPRHPGPVSHLPARAASLSTTQP